MGDSCGIVLRIGIFAFSLFPGLSPQAQEWQAPSSGGGLIGYMCRVQPDFVACRPASVDEQRTPPQIETNWRLARDQSSDNQQTIQSRSQRNNESMKHFNAAMQIANVELRTEKRRPLSADDSTSQFPNPGRSDADLVEASMNNGGDVVIGYRNRNFPSSFSSSTQPSPASLPKDIMPPASPTLPEEPSQTATTLSEVITIPRLREPNGETEVLTTEIPRILSSAPGFMPEPPGFLSQAPGFLPQAPGFMPQEAVVPQQRIQSQETEVSTTLLSPRTTQTTILPLESPKATTEQLPEGNRQSMEESLGMGPEKTTDSIASTFEQTTHAPTPPTLPPAEVVVEKHQKPPVDIRRS